MGEVKTRLQPEINQENSLLLYKAMVQDIIEQLNFFDLADVIIFYWPFQGFKECVDWLGPHHYFVHQEGNNLGERMLNAFRWTFNKGYIKTVLIGSDLPSLDSSILNDAFERLNQTDVVLGPSKDGGYYLIGMKKLHHELFMEIPWGTDCVFNLTVNKAHEMKLSITALEEERDIDTYEDVLSLWKRIQNKSIGNKEDSLKQTINVLYQLLNKRGDLHGTETRE